VDPAHGDLGQGWSEVSGPPAIDPWRVDNRDFTALTPPDPKITGNTAVLGMMNQPAVLAADDGGDEGVHADPFDQNRDEVLILVCVIEGRGSRRPALRLYPVAPQPMEERAHHQRDRTVP
jgi:hypothetical protein